MKVGLMAFHHALNYGAVLQIVSLQRQIEKLGHEGVIIDYYAQGTTQWDCYQKIQFNKKFLSIMKWNTFLLTMRRKKRKNFDLFLKQIKMTDFLEYRDLLKTNEQFDTFIVGSDQVWNCNTMGMDSAYFLDFVTDSKKKNSYAASFGYSKIPDEYLEFTRKGIQDFENISVRETQGKEIVEAVIQRDVPVVLDPVFFSAPEDWNLSSDRSLPYKYIFVYQPQKSTTLAGKARLLAQKCRAKVVIVSRTWDGLLGSNTVNKSAVSPDDFLRLIRDAEYIVTNSFHGIAFSIIFNKQFFAEYNAGTSSRIESVLNVFNLKNRRLQEEQDFSSLSEIDYLEVNRILEKELLNSERYLRDILERNS